MVDESEIVEVDDVPTEKPKRRGGRKPGTGSAARNAAPGHTEYMLPFSKGFIGLSMAAAFMRQAPGYVMSEQEANAIAKPAAKMFAKSALARKYGRYVAGSNDGIALAVALFQYTQHAAARQAIYEGHMHAAQPQYQQPTPPSQPNRYASTSSGAQPAGNAGTESAGVVYADDGLPVLSIDPGAIADLTPGRGD